MPVYSFGADAPLKFKLSRQIAQGYNKVMDMDPDDWILPALTKKDWKGYAEVINLMEDWISRNGPIPYEYEPETWLVENVGAKLFESFGSVIGATAFLAVVWELLRK